MKWEGRRQSSNVEDRQIKDPMAKTAQMQAISTEDYTRRARNQARIRKVTAQLKKGK